jgi:replication factor A1
MQVDVPVKKEESPIKTYELPVEKTFKPKVEEVRRTPMQDLSSNNYMPIKALNTFARDWIIKARIASKGEKKTTRNGGFLMKIELVDQYGTQIEGTFFNDAANKFENILQKDKVYLFSNGNVKMANKKFTSVRNDFCIVFEKHSIIDEAKDDGSITNQAFDFCSISEISDIL